MADKDLSDLLDDPAAPDDSGDDVEMAKGEEPSENADGSVDVDLGKDDKAKEQDNSEFYANLAETMDSSELMAIAIDLLEKLESDKNSRAERDKKYAEGLRRTGMGDDAPGGAQFEGASKVVHPLLTEVAVDFSARAVKELFPNSGPVKEFIPGEVNQQKVDKAKRKTRWMNWQTTEQMPEFRSDLEQLLTQLPLAGSSYLKIRWDERKNRPITEFVPIDDVYVPFAAASYYTAERKTHVQKLTKQEFESRVRSGMYRDINITSAPLPDDTRAQKASHKIEGKTEDSLNIDNVRVVYEVACQYVLTDGKRGVNAGDEAKTAPYLITIDENTHQVVAIYRNWDEKDELEEELHHMAEFMFVPWRGAYGIGMTHMIGGLSGAATGALRALLDSALINNFPGGVKMKGGPMGGQNVRVDPLNINELDGAAGLIDDIRKLYMNIPVNQPSPALVSLLTFLVDAGKSVVKTTLDENPDGSQNVPVGTQMSRVEQGLTVFSAIHARMHNSMKCALKILHRINKTWLKNSDVKKLTGEQMTTREDFDGAMDVVPVSDPNIFSELQRFAQIQTIAQRAQLAPQLYDVYKVELAILERMKVPDPKSFLIPKPEPTLANAVNENMAMSLGRPVVAFPLQDHMAHIKTHVDFFQNPLFGQSTQIAAKFIPAFIRHLTEHMLLWYATTVYHKASEVAKRDISEYMNTKDPEIDQEFDRMMQDANALVLKNSAEYLGQVPAIIQQAQALMQKIAPPPPPMMDPAQATVQVAQMNNQTKQQQLQQQATEFAQTQQGNQQKQAAQDAASAEADQLKSQTQLQVATLGSQTKLTTTQMDNATAENIATADIIAGKHSNVTDGERVGKESPA